MMLASLSPPTFKAAAANKQHIKNGYAAAWVGLIACWTCHGVERPGMPQGLGDVPACMSTPPELDAAHVLMPQHVEPTFNRIKRLVLCMLIWPNSCCRGQLGAAGSVQALTSTG